MNENLNPNEVFNIMFMVWIGLGLISFLFFTFNKNVRLKKIVFPLSVILTSFLFVYFGYPMGFRGSIQFYYIIPATVVIGLLNIITTRVCNQCSKLVSGYNPITKNKHCPKCGSKL